jgi:class 3 adenylate cyclase/tetratricopeptide (TPR) repeat protein
VRCEACGSENRAAARFCDQCAAPFAPDVEGTRGTERRQLTVMFCDLVGSTELSQRLDPEELRDVVRAYQETAGDVLRDAAGHVAQYLGDGLLVYFGYPRAQEDDAQRAVRAGLDILAAMAHRNVGLEAERGVRLAVRIGIHTGPVVVGEMGGGERRERLALGETLNVAARLQGIAAPDAVVISAATHRIVHAGFDCTALGPQALKGMAQTVSAYHVHREHRAQTRSGATATAGLTPLVGRVEETAVVLGRWTAARDGAGHTVLLSGEPGIGKSRLVATLKERVATAPHVVLEGGCAPHRQLSAFHPLTDLLERVLDLDPGDGADVGLAKLESHLRAHGLPVATATPLLAPLLAIPLSNAYAPLGLGPERLRQRTQETLREWLLAMAASRPMLLVIEDLHWADPSTLDLLPLLVDDAARARVLLVLTTRPGFDPPWQPAAPVTEVPLPRLTPAEATLMVTHVAGTSSLSARVVEQIVAKTDGIPLFVEELTRMVLEAGPGPDGALAERRIPATLQDSLMARLDRLDTAKAVAQLASAIGREFSHELLAAVAPLAPEALARALGELVDADLLQRRGSGPRASYGFRHALIQDAAYESLLRATRQQHHARIAEVLASRFPQTPPEVVAHHFTEAGRANDAITFWRRAARRALERSANAEAVAHVSRALQLLVGLPETPGRDQQELLLQTILGPALMATEGYASPRVSRAFARAHALCERVDDAPRVFPILRGLNISYLLQGKLQTAHDLSEQLLRRARGAHDDHALLEAHFAIGQTLFYRGEFPLARDHLAEGAARYDPERYRADALRHGQDVGIFCHHLGAVTSWFLGRPDRALAQGRHALALARAFRHSDTLAATLSFVAYLHLLRREAAAARALGEELAVLADAQGLPFWAAGADATLGAAAVLEDRLTDGVALLRDGAAAWRAIGALLSGPLYVPYLAEAYGRDGRPAEGLRVVDEALFLVSQNGERAIEAELLRLRGELLGDREESCATLREALDVARRQEARSLELRVAMSLVRLGNGEGRDALLAVHDGFTEGLETADLQAARTMLAGAATP